MLSKLHPDNGTVHIFWAGGLMFFGVSSPTSFDHWMTPNHHPILVQCSLRSLREVKTTNGFIFQEVVEVPVPMTEEPLDMAMGAVCGVGKCWSLFIFLYHFGLVWISIAEHLG